MATDFFDRQDEARKRTGWLVFYFVIAVVLIILTVYGAFTGLLVWATSKETRHAPAAIFDPVRLGIVAAFTGIVILLGSLYKIIALREGGAAVARSLGGRLVEGNTSDPTERRLLNVIEEMALASGVPVPPVYILDEEPGINAFAAGYAPGDAVIGVTRGTINHLSRDQLQGVIAHEFSHILNGDMRLDLKIMGILHGILLLAILGQILLRFGGGGRSSRSSDGKKDNSALFFLLMGVALLVIGYIGVFFGRIIKSAVSRQREFLADASAVQFTRNPEGLGGALKKIGGLSLGSSVQSPGAEEACHMFFGSAVSAMSSLMATHPPLEERIKRIDPQFDGRFAQVRLDEGINLAPATKAQVARPDRGIGGLGNILPGVNIPGNLGGAILMPLAGSVETIGTPTSAHMDYASDLVSGLPETIRAAAREPYGASSLIYALLLDDRPEILAKQVAVLSKGAFRGQAEQAVQLARILADLGPETRLPIAELSLPALQKLSDDQYGRFHANVTPLIDADNVETLFEFALRRLLFRHLDRKFLKLRPPAIRYNSVESLLGNVSKLIGALAWIGQDDPAEIERAYRAGLERLGPEADRTPLPAREECTLAVVDQGLGELAAAAPVVKKRVLEACAAAISADGEVTIAEGELLRAIADALDCPMPPLLRQTS